jgi:hypothetical protein
MSRFEVYELVNRPCPCGSGRIKVTRYSPDHAFGSDTYAEEIACGACAKSYRLHFYHARDIRLHRQADLDAYHAALYERQARADALAAASPAIQKLQKRLLASLAEERSVAAKHRWLVSKRVVSGSLSQFRRHFVSDQATVDEVIRCGIGRFTAPPELAAISQQYLAIVKESVAKPAYEQLGSQG